MQNLSFTPTRRDAFRLATLAGLAFATESWSFAADFWTKKQASEWTDDEKESLAKKSPWAHKIEAELTRMGGGGGGSSDSGSGGGGGGAKGGKGGGGGGGGKGSDDSGGGPPTVSLVVTWESAAPMVAARKFQLSANLKDHYVIGVEGLPSQVIMAAMREKGRGRGQAAAEAPPPLMDPTAMLKQAATLVVKGKPAVNADIIQQTPDHAVTLFGFPKSALPLAAGDKEVVFNLAFTGLKADCRFSLKDMTFSDSLAV